MTAFRLFIAAILLSLLAFTPQPSASSTTVHAVNGALQLPSNVSASDKLSQPLRALLAQLSAQPDARVNIIVRFAEQINLDRAMRKAKTPSRVDRAIALTDALQDTANISQRNVAAYLAQPSIASNIGEVHQLWVINGLALSATPDVIHALAAYPEVASIVVDEWQTRILEEEPRTKSQEPRGENQEPSTHLQSLLAPTPVPPTNTFPISVGLSAVAYVSPPSKGDVTQALGAIGVDRVWKGLGVTGKGIVVGNIDTGVDWNHPALKTRYRGYDERGIGPANHLHNWFDPTNEGAFYPSDVNGHGTHTMGTMVAGNGIGVAPEAKWIAAKGFNGQGQGLNSWLHRSIQFMLAPGGKAEYAPDILNNSWGNTNPTETEFARDVEVLNAAGIVTFWASGNSGPRSGSIASPASMLGAFSVGATDDENDVANFSGRGPTPDGLMRPHIVAPGVRIVSTYPGGNYSLSTGTSQATPHVAGVAALLLSVKPALDITQTQYVLTSTAIPIGEPVPNNDAGWGLVDAYAAVLSQVQTGVITGTVLDNGQPISGAMVSAIGDVYQAYDVTDANGNFIIKVRAGSYSLKVNAYGYFEAYSNPRAISANQTVAMEVQMRRMPSGVLRGVVTDARTGEQLPANVRAIGTPRNSVAHHNCFPCRYYLDLPAGEYMIEARLTGYLIQTRTVNIVDGVVTDFDFVLNPTQKIVLVDSGAWYLSSFSQYYTESLEALGLAYDVMRIKQIPRDVITTPQLLKYDTIIWSSPSDAPSFTNGDDVISETLALGKNLLLTGQDVAYYDGGGRSSRPYFDKINAWFVDTNDKSIRVEGISQTLLAGRMFTLTGVGGAQNQETPDIIRVRNPDNGHLIANYAAVEVKPSTTLTPAGLPPSRGAGIFTSQCLTYSVAFLPFGLEGVNQAAHRTDIMSQILQAFVQPRPQTGFELTPLNPPPTGATIGLPGEVVTHSFRVRHTGEAGLPETFQIAFGGNKWRAEASTASGPRDLHEISLTPCSSTIVTLTVSIPPDAPRHTSDALTVSITPRTWSPDLKRSLRFTSKTPAAVMLVDDDRFYDREQDYLDALAATGATVDHWDTRSSLGSQFTQSPGITELRRYPLVVWFNGYDWFDPISPAERETMRQYLGAGGRLFFTSQAALYYSSGPEQRQAPDFDRNVLGVNYVDFGDNVTQISGVPGSVLGDGLPSGSLSPFPYGFNLSAAVQPMPDTQVVLRGDSGQPFGLARRQGIAKNWGLGIKETSDLQSLIPNPQSIIPNPISAESRHIFFPFAFEVLNKHVQAEWMNRIVGWLSPLGQSDFSATPANIPAGGQFTYSLTLRADELLNTLGAYTSTRVAISVTLPNALKVLTHTLPPGSLGNGWRGIMTQGDVLAWRIVAQHTNADIGRREVLTAHLHITLPDLGLHFSQPVAVRVAPLLRPSIQVDPQPLQWRELATVTIALRNVSSNDAPQVHLRHAVPTRLSLIEPSLTLTPTGVGELALLGNRLDWTGTLTAGHAITISYQMTLPRFGFNNALAFFNQVVVNEGNDGVAHAETWLVPETVRILFPVLWQGQFSDTASLTDTITTTVSLH